MRKWCSMGKRLDIMLAFISPVTRNIVLQYPEIPNGIIQTNEAGLLYIEKLLNKKGHSLDMVYCLSTKTVRDSLLSDNKNFSSWKMSPEFKRIGDVTHFQFLSKRMQEHDASWSGKLEMVKCNDLNENSSEGSAQILRDISKITDRLLQLKTDDVEELVIHCDITGGFRHGSAMLMVILQLLKYHGITTGNVIYTDVGKKIYEINNLQSMFTLINGADEFVNHGNASVLDKYFKNLSDKTTSVELDGLLKAMNNFSNAVNLCVPNIIDEVVKNLRTALQSFEASKNLSFEEEIFSKLLKRIRSEYNPFLLAGSEAFISINIVRWCMDKGLWQQAMTFANELFPRYICDKRIVYPAKDSYKHAEKLHPHWENNYIVSSAPFPYTDYKKTSNVKSVEEEKLYDVFINIINNNSYELETRVSSLGLNFNRLKVLINDIRNADDIIGKMRMEMDSQLKGQLKIESAIKIFPTKIMSEHKDFAMLIKFMFLLDASNTQSFISYIYKTASRENICKKILNCNLKTIPLDIDLVVLLQFIQTFKTKKRKTNLSKITDNSIMDEQMKETEAWQRKADMWSLGLEIGAVQTNFKGRNGEIVELLHSFDNLRNARNRINHAADLSISLVEELKKVRLCLTDLLNKLSKF